MQLLVEGTLVSWVFRLSPFLFENFGSNKAKTLIDLQINYLYTVAARNYLFIMIIIWYHFIIVVISIEDTDICNTYLLTLLAQVNDIILQFKCHSPKKARLN